MYLLEHSAIIHNGKMSFIDFSGSIIIRKIIVSSSYPKYFVNKNFQWVNRSQHNYKSQIDFLLLNCDWIVNIFLSQFRTCFENTDDSIEIIGYNHVHTSSHIWWFNDPYIILVLFFSFFKFANK